MYDTVIYNKRQVCFMINRYNVERPRHIESLLFTAKENEALKQRAYAR